MQHYSQSIKTCIEGFFFWFFIFVVVIGFVAGL